MVDGNRQARPRVAVIGGGPAGLMAAEVLVASQCVDVDIYDAMPSFARKFLLAGKGGLSRYLMFLGRRRCATGRKGWVWRLLSAVPGVFFQPK